jgi:hypothetical protein
MDVEYPREVIWPLESDPERKKQEIEDLKARLVAETQGRGQIARLTWRLQHLEEFLYRWIGCLPFFTMGAFLHNDLHIVLIIGVDLVDDEIGGLHGCDALKASWHAFATAVREIGENTDKGVADSLKIKFEQVCNILLACERR